MSSRIRLRDQHWFVATALIVGWVMIGLWIAIALFLVWTKGFRWAFVAAPAVLSLMLLKIMYVLEKDEGVDD